MLKQVITNFIMSKTQGLKLLENPRIHSRKDSRQQIWENLTWFSHNKLLFPNTKPHTELLNKKTCLFLFHCIFMVISNMVIKFNNLSIFRYVFRIFCSLLAMKCLFISLLAYGYDTLKSIATVINNLELM